MTRTACDTAAAVATAPRPATERRPRVPNVGVSCKAARTASTRGRADLSRPVRNQ